MTWDVIDSYGAVVHTADTLTECGTWIDPVLGIDFTGKAWGRKKGKSIDADRFTKNDDGSYTVQMYEGPSGIGGELTVRKRGKE